MPNRTATKVISKNFRILESTATMAAANATFSPLLHFLSAPSQWSVDTPILAIVSGIAVIFMSAFLLRSRTSDKIYDLGGISVLTAWNFFKKRFDFIRGNFKKSGGKMFRFWVLQASGKASHPSRWLICPNHHSTG